MVFKIILFDIFKIIIMFVICSYCDINQMLYCEKVATQHIVLFNNKFL